MGIGQPVDRLLAEEANSNRLRMHPAEGMASRRFPLEFRFELEARFGSPHDSPGSREIV